MRGKPTEHVSFFETDRITPADAGKTARCTYDTNLNRDHPRGCGENLSLKFKIRKSAGSPPRMRGKLNTKMPAYPLSRITPADAGKTKGRTQKRALSWDHPRGCGENLVHLLRGLLPPGSPPRMRGKRASVRKSGVSIRITPADAGKTHDR